MTKDVLITIRGLQFVSKGDDADPVEVVSPGEYYFKNGSHYLLFDEVTEGFTESTHNMMKFRDNHLEVRKKGLVDVNMVYETNKKTLSYYHTPFGVMHMGIATTSFNKKETEDEIQLKVDYALEMNESFVADCTIYINVKSREAGNFRLSPLEDEDCEHKMLRVDTRNGE